MVSKFDQIIVIDVEATCWEPKMRPVDQEHEIIEIGICVLDIQTGKRLSKESILVRPERSQVSPFCTELTSLTPEQVNRGVSFSKACAILREKYSTKQRTWASYGDYDRKMFEKQCAEAKVIYPFGSVHLNIKNLFAIMMGLPREIGLANAMHHIGTPFDGTHHRGHDDAWNAALILSKLILRVPEPEQ